MILVAGGAGFIGSHLIRALLDEGHEVAAIEHRTPLPEDLRGRVELFGADVTVAAEVENLPTNLEAVCYLAMAWPRVEKPADLQYCLAVNTIGAGNLLEHCRRHDVRQFVYSSSVAVYGSPDRFPIGETGPLKPENFYAASKLAAEHLCDVYRNRHGMRCACLRYASVYGPGQPPDVVLPLFLRKASQGETITIYGEGKKVQDFVYVQDVTRANRLALQKEANGVYNIGSGVGTPVVELAEAVIECFPDTGSRIVLDKEKKEDSSRICLDITKARRELGYQPAFSLREGLAAYQKSWEPV